MGLIEQEINELRGLQEKVYSGEVPLDVAATQIAISNQIAKREQLLHNLLVSQLKYGVKAVKQITDTNIIGKGTAIEVVGGSEAIVCKGQGGLCIDRDTCLDFSGCAVNMDACQDCQHFTVTRQQLLPKERRK